MGSRALRQSYHTGGRDSFARAIREIGRTLWFWSLIAERGKRSRWDAAMRRPGVGAEQLYRGRSGSHGRSRRDQWVRSDWSPGLPGHEASENTEIAAINDLSDAKHPVMLFKQDSVHGRFAGTVSSGEKLVGRPGASRSRSLKRKIPRISLGNPCGARSRSSRPGSSRTRIHCANTSTPALIA